MSGKVFKETILHKLISKTCSSFLPSDFIKRVGRELFLHLEVFKDIADISNGVVVFHRTSR